MFNLPSDILRNIFQYDNTYRNIFSEKVLVYVWGSALRRSLKTFEATKDQRKMRHANEDHLMINPDDEDYHIDVNKMTVITKVAVEYMYIQMGFYNKKDIKRNNYLFGIGSDFYMDDVRGVCRKQFEYIPSKDKNECVENWMKNGYYAVTIYIKEKRKFDGIIYTNIDNADNISDDNENLLFVHYNAEEKLALYTYV